LSHLREDICMQNFSLLASTLWEEIERTDRRTSILDLIPVQNFKKHVWTHPSLISSKHNFIILKIVRVYVIGMPEFRIFLSEKQPKGNKIFNQKTIPNQNWLQLEDKREVIVIQIDTTSDKNLFITLRKHENLSRDAFTDNFCFCMRNKLIKSKPIY